MSGWIQAAMQQDTIPLDRPNTKSLCHLCCFKFHSFGYTLYTSVKSEKCIPVTELKKTRNK